jgi:hypothetical protein
MVKRLAVLVAVAGSSVIGFVAPTAAHAADCPAGTVIAVHLNGNLNGTPVQQDICLPPAS